MAFSLTLPGTTFVPRDGAFTGEDNNLTGLYFPLAGTPEGYSVPFQLPSTYAGGTITLSLHHYTPSAASGTVIFEALFRALDGLADRAFATEQTDTHTRVGGVTAIEVADITFTSAQIDGATAGDLIQIQIRRNGGTATGNAIVIAAVLSEA